MIFSLSLLQVVILFLISAPLIAWLYIQWAYHRQLAVARKLPTSIPAFPLIGHLIYMRTEAKVGDRVWELASGHPSGLSTIWLGPVPWLMVNKAEHMKVIMNNSHLLEKAKLYDAFHYVFGNGLITAPAHLWKMSRKHINVLFNSENLQNFGPIMNETARHLVEDLAEHDGGGMFECEDHSFSFSLNNVLKLLFGLEVEIDRKSDEFKDMYKNIQIISHSLGERAYNPFLQCNIIMRLLRKQIFTVLEELRKHIRVYIRKCQNQKSSQASNERLKKGKTFLDISSQLEAINPVFDQKYALDELLTLTGTGSDTNALAMSSCLMALGSHPEIQNNLYNEILSVVGDSSEVYEEDIVKMTYLDQVMKETLRYFTIAPLAARRCDRDVQLGDHIIPEGTTVVLSFLGLHHNEEVFPDPLRFDPDRFSPDNTSKRHSYSFLPFSGGPRSCIGKNYAMMAFKITLVHVLKNYEIKSSLDMKNTVYKFNISMVPVSGYHISIKKRV